MFKGFVLSISLISVIFISSCSKELYFSGVSENSLNEIKQNYQSQEYTKENISKFIGSPLVQENSGNLWIYNLVKEQGNASFKKTIYNKTLKLKFENNILRSVEEIDIN